MTKGNDKLAKLLNDYQEQFGSDSLSSLFSGSDAEVLGRGMSVTLTSAIKLDVSDKKLVVDYLKHKLGETPKIKYLTDDTLIAGFTLKIGDDLIDSSLASKISSIKDQLIVK